MVDNDTVAVQLDYFYGMQSEMFSFLRIPKILIKDGRFEKMSNESKMLFGLLLDRMSLSMKNRWFDEEDRVYIIYTTDEIMIDLCMNELRNSKSDDQLEELLLLTEQMQEELDQKDRTIRKLKVQLDESLTLNEKLNSENKTENIQALKNDLRKTKELLQSEKEKTHTAQTMIRECRDKQRQAEQERDHALSHQKKVEIPVEKPVLYQKCGNCNQTAYLKAKERYDTQREKLAGRYKAKTAMYEALMFLLIWYSVSTTLFQMIRSKIFISDCVVFFDTIATFIQTIAGWIILTGKNVAQISDGISNPVVAGIIYWLIRILVCGGCLVGAGLLLAFIGIKIARLYKKYCWDMITILVTLISMVIAIYFGDWIKAVLPINLLFLLLFVQLVYVGSSWYVKGWREARGYY